MRSFTFLLAFALSGAFTASGDQWAAPRNAIYGSGPFGVKVLLEKERGALMRVFSLDDSGSEIVRWERRLDYIPHRVHVSDRGWVVAQDRYANLGFEHALVIFDPSGLCLGDYTLENFLTADEIARFSMRTVSSRFWNAQFDFQHDGYQGTYDWLILTVNPKDVTAKDNTSKTITFDLRTGKLWPDFAPNRANYHLMQNQISEMRAKYGFVAIDRAHPEPEKPALREDELRIYARENISAIEWELSIEPDGSATEKSDTGGVRKFQVPDSIMKGLKRTLTTPKFRKLPDVQEAAPNDPSVRSIVVEGNDWRKAATVCPKKPGINDSAFGDVWRLIEKARKQQ